MNYSASGQKKISDGDVDYRYTIRVFLLREGRPKYYEFYCCHCGVKIAELNGTLLYMTDLMSDGNTTGVIQVNRVRCKGKYCDWWYEFVLSA